MNPFRQYPRFTATLACCGLLVAGEVWGLVAQRRAAGRAEGRLELKMREAHALAAADPAATPANAALVESDLAAATATLAAMRSTLQGRTTIAPAVTPERPADAYFDIADYVERMRDRAKQADVAVRADERFGFSDYANTGPEAALIPMVHRQRRVAEYLLEALFAARPHRLLGLQRERPAPAGGTAGHREGAASADTFDVDPTVTARVPGFVDATAFRVSFTGPTAALRDWLNRLATFELPLVVRSVEVDRAPAGDATPDAPVASALLVPRALSRFTVTIELIDLVSPPAAPEQ